MDEIPAIGRIVHVKPWQESDPPRPAIVVGHRDDLIDVVVFGQSYVTPAELVSNLERHRWEWPPRGEG